MKRSYDWGFPRWGGYGTDRETIAVRMCDRQGCDHRGEHRAPKSRDGQNYWWFCRPHAEEYNRSWNFFSGMSKAEADQWSNRKPESSAAYAQNSPWSDASGPESFFNAIEREALEILGLDEDASARDVKSQFRALAKKYHPDTNRHDNASELQFKRVRTAYEILKDKDLTR